MSQEKFFTRPESQPKMLYDKNTGIWVSTLHTTSYILKASTNMKGDVCIFNTFRDRMNPENLFRDVIMVSLTAALSKL